jgi:hypothetical protein
MGGGSSKKQVSPLQQALEKHDVDAVKALLEDPNTVLSSTPAGKTFRRKKSQETEVKYREANEKFKQRNYVEGVPPVVFAAKHCADNPAKTAEIFELLLASPRVTVNREIGWMAAGFAYNFEAPLVALKGDSRTGLDEWEVGKDPSAWRVQVNVIGLARE